MQMSQIEHEGIRATIDYRQYSYIASLVRISDNCMLTQKCFGNGISAEEWILKELSLPSSIVLIRYS